MHLTHLELGAQFYRGFDLQHFCLDPRNEEEGDLISTTYPFKVVTELQKKRCQEIRETDADYYKKLEAAGPGSSSIFVVSRVTLCPTSSRMSNILRYDMTSTACFSRNRIVNEIDVFFQLTSGTCAPFLSQLAVVMNLSKGG